MAVVTVTGQLGATGTVPTRVALALRYRQADQLLVSEAAQTLGLGADDVARWDETTQNAEDASRACCVTLWSTRPSTTRIPTA